MKTRHRKTTKTTRKLAPISARRSHSPAADLQEQLDRRTSELDEALAHQIATGEVLSVISRSPADAQPVFDAIVESAARLCGAMYSSIYLSDDGRLRIAASKNYRLQAINRLHALRERLEHPVRFHLAGRAMLDRTIIHVSDVLADPEYSRELALAGGWRAVLAVPLLRDGEPVGAISVAKAEPTPFSDRQIQLLKTFADHALIAIENVRLFEAEQQRTRELSESLEQQTATSEVLRVISSSPGELEPVFQAMLENALRICEAKFGFLHLYENGAFRTVVRHNAPPAYSKEFAQRGALQLGPLHPLVRVATTKQLVHISNYAEDPAYKERDPAAVRLVELAQARTVVVVPMLKEDELIGAIHIYRQEVKPFTEKQIALVQNFAAQAVIAIENARLLNELRQRTDDLTESLEQRTATSEVLKIVASSRGDLQPVFHSILQNAAHICEASFGTLFRFDGKFFHPTASIGTPAALVEYQKQRGPFQPEAERGNLTDRVWYTKQVAQTADYAAEPNPGPPAKIGGARSAVAVPMLKDNKLVGAIVIYRKEVRPFSNKQIELVTTFADQAVIAIENTRLLSELRESLQQQTATSEVLSVISSSGGELE